MTDFHEHIRERLEEAEVAIEQLHWLAAKPDVRSYEDYLEPLTELNARELKELFGFPGDFIEEVEVESFSEEDIAQFLADHNCLGFLAMCLKPICRHFSFDGDGKPESWQSSWGAGYPFLAYGNTLEDLVEQIEAKAQQLFEEDLATHLKSGRSAEPQKN